MHDFEFVYRHRIITRPEYWFDIDEYGRGPDRMYLAHLRFARWSPSVFKTLLADWKAFREVVTTPLFACGEDDDDTFEHFATRCGWRFHSNVICENGEHRRLFIHTV